MQLNVGVIQGKKPSAVKITFVTGAHFVFLHAQYDEIRLDITCRHLLILEQGESERNRCNIA